MSNFLTRQAILAVPLRTQEVFIPEWGGSVLVKEMTAKQVADNGRFVLTRDGKADMSKAVQVPVQMCLQQVVDEQGERLFSDADIKHIEALHAGAVSRIAEAVRRLSGVQDTEDNSDLGRWLEETRPDVLAEYRESQGAIKVAEENFILTLSENSRSN